MQYRGRRRDSHAREFLRERTGPWRCAETSAIAFLAGVYPPCRSRSSWSPVLDYGGGDGKFAVLCAESLSLQEIVTYDPAPRMTSLARSLCANFKQIRVAEAIQEIQSGRFDVVTFNAVWMCLTSREACLDTLSEIASFFTYMAASSHRRRIHVFGPVSFRTISRT